MRILLVSTLKRRVASDVTASRSQIIYRLAAGLVKRGHSVSLLGTGDSFIEGVETIPVIEKGWEGLASPENPFYRDTATLVKLAKEYAAHAGDYDIVHNHTYPEFINLLTAEQHDTPFVTTLHQQATPMYDETLSLFSTPFVALSRAHQHRFVKSHPQFVVYNGVDTDVFTYRREKEDYLLWLGRLSKAKNENGEYIDPKGVRWAVQLARETGQRLLLSGAVEDRAFFEKDVAPFLSDKIQWVGEVASSQSLPREEIVSLMQKAKAFLMTVNWEEPFGLVMAEAGSCGTPVIGFDRGSVAEVIENGVTGFVVEPEAGIAGLKKALGEIEKIDSAACRKRVEEHFSLSSMVLSYENVYKNLLHDTA